MRWVRAAAAVLCTGISAAACVHSLQDVQPSDPAPDARTGDATADAWVSISVDGGADAGTADAAECSAGTTRCMGNAAETCLSSERWGTPVSCGAGAPFCVDGNCLTSPRSCQPDAGGLGDDGRNNCGASVESCCTSLLVDTADAGATFYRTYTNDGSGPSGLADPATLSGFRLDKYEVTVGRFRAFVAAWNDGWRPAPGSGKHSHLNAGRGLNATFGGYERGWEAIDSANVTPTYANLYQDDPYSTWTADVGGNEKKPINKLNWYEAYAFCIWDGGFLPSEAEWEFAAAGGGEQLEHPWGSASPDEQYAIFNCNYPGGGDAGTCTDVTNVAPVGTAASGGGRWGQLDLAGNEYEWILDGFEKYGDCIDCVGLRSIGNRGLRGSGFSYSASALISWNRDYGPPDARGTDIGFRCARSP